MKLDEFLESTYISANIEYHEVRTLKNQAKTLAIGDMTNMYRSIHKFLAYFQIALSFILVRLHIKSAPFTAAELMKAASESVPVKEAAVTPIVQDQSEPTEHHADGVK